MFRMWMGKRLLNTYSDVRNFKKFHQIINRRYKMILSMLALMCLIIILIGVFIFSAVIETILWFIILLIVTTIITIIAMICRIIIYPFNFIYKRIKKKW